MSRRTARRHAFFLTFQIEFYVDYDPLAQAKLYLDGLIETPFDEEELCDGGVTEEDGRFILSELCGVYDNLGAIDALISENLSGWEIDRINKTDLAIIRLAVYEMLYEASIPPGVSINEAVELAKQYGTDESYQFVNGILGRVYELTAACDG